MKLNELLLEVEVKRYTDSKGKTLYADSQMPLKDSQTIRVYHAFDSAEELSYTLTHGLSGTQRASRRYSYEGNNNPYGLFITPDFNTAKKFGHYIIEFHTKVSDLEAPQWPGGSFAVQGQYAQMFDHPDDRESEMLLNREKYSKDEHHAIRDSDRPELAAMLYNTSEPQALFIGNLDPNSIRAVWIADDTTVSSTYTSYSRLSRKDALRYLSNITQNSKTAKTPKIAKPRESVTLDKLLDLFQEKYPHLKDRKEIIDILLRNPDYIERKLWSREQKETIWKELEKFRKDK